MRVLVVTNMYPTAAEPWAGSFVHDQVEDLRALGVDVHVTAFDGRSNRAEYARAGTRLSREVARIEPELVHAHYGLTGAVALAQRRAPVATTFHGSDTVVPWQRCVSWAVARLTTPVFVAESGRRLLRRDGAVIPCGVDVERFRPRDRGRARAGLGWHPEDPYVVFPGSRAKALKRADRFDAAVAAARQKLPSLQAVALEGLSRDDAALVLAAADVTLMTSDWEGSPVTVKESLACATPVVSVPVGDVPALVDGLPGCAVRPPEATALGAAVVDSVSTPRSPALRERAIRFSRPRMARRVLDVYERVLAA